MTENYELIDNEEKHQYEFHVEGYVPRIEYIKILKWRDLSDTYRSTGRLGRTRNRFTTCRESSH